MVVYVGSGMCWLKQMFPSWARGRETNCPRQFKWFKKKILRDKLVTFLFISISREVVLFNWLECRKYVIDNQITDGLLVFHLTRPLPDLKICNISDFSHCVGAGCLCLFKLFVCVSGCCYIFVTWRRNGLVWSPTHGKSPIIYLMVTTHLFIAFIWKLFWYHQS